ncbi:MAG: hypothetical protein AMXMBFR58_01440 [Phycisphaerae bacterium]
MNDGCATATYQRFLRGHVRALMDEEHTVSRVAAIDKLLLAMVREVSIFPNKTAVSHADGAAAIGVRADEASRPGACRGDPTPGSPRPTNRPDTGWHGDEGACGHRSAAAAGGNQARPREDERDGPG